MEPESSFRIHKYPPTVPLLSQFDPVHTPKSHFLKIQLNIILQSRPGSPKWFKSQQNYSAKPDDDSSVSQYNVRGT